MISGIGWVSELIEAAGGIDVFPQLAARKNAKDRIVSPDEVIAAAARHHRRLVVRQKIRAEQRSPPGRALPKFPPSATGWLREIKSTLILQPGPAALTDGLDQMARIVSEWAENAERPAS